MSDQIFPFKPISFPAIAPRPTPCHDVTPGQSPPPPSAVRKRSRASKPKVRTGCKTCKIRRIKCDETKPICRQCSKVRMVCDGYEYYCHPGGSGSGTSTPSPGPSPTRTKFHAKDIAYLDFFRYQLIDEFAGYSCTDFWSRVVLCDAMTSDCARHVVLAIASLTKAISEVPREKHPSPLTPWTAESVVNSTHGVALHHYVNALSTFRHQQQHHHPTTLKNKGVVQSPRSVLIMTLLFITFELLQGNMEAVDSLLTTSIRLLRGSLTHFFRNDDLSVIPPQRGKYHKEDDVEDIEHMLPFLSITGGWTPFLRTQQANLTIWDTSPLVDNVPCPDHRLSPTQLQTLWGRFFLRATAFTAQSFTAVTNPPCDQETLSRRWWDEQQTYLTQLGQWQAVIDTTLEKTTIPSLFNQKETDALRVMRLHCQMLKIGVTCCLDASDTLWDAFDTDFDTLVTDCLTLASTTTSSAANNKDPKHKFHGRWTMQMGILSTLGPAIAKCRNHDIRMRALAIARRMPWREGAWDAEAELYGKLGAVLLEERGRDVVTGKVTAENRWTWVDGRWDVSSAGGNNNNKLVGRYVRSVPDAGSGQPVFRVLELGLDKLPDICADVGCEMDHGVECRAFLE